MQQHVASRTSTQARSHAQKFFVKLEKKNLSLQQFLDDLDLEKLKASLMNPETMNSTNYNEEEAVNAVAKKRASASGVSVMNAALPPAPLEELKTPEKRKRTMDSPKPKAGTPPQSLA